MKFIGAHVDATPTLASAPQNAAAIGAAAFAFNTAPANVWGAPDPSPEECQAFKDACRDNGFSAAAILPHSGFLMNLGSPDARKLAMSRKALTDEFGRCALLGLSMINFHPGATLNLIDDDECLQRIAKGIDAAHQKHPGITAVVENTAGQGSNLGYGLEHLARIIELVADKTRIGVCIDTCHAYAAGYDLADEEGYDRFWADFDRLIGAQYLRGMHLNDAARPLASRIDRHAPIGAGNLGNRFFARLLADPRTDGIPLILETPDPSLWPAEIAALYGYSVGVPPQ